MNKVILTKVFLSILVAFSILLLSNQLYSKYYENVMVGTNDPKQGLGRSIGFTTIHAFLTVGVLGLLLFIIWRKK